VKQGLTKQLVKQRGVALITAVLIVALVTATAVAMASKQQFDIRRTANIFNNDKAYQFALGAEDYARNVLEWDITKNGSTSDHLGEDWAQEVSVPVEGAMLTGTVEDLQGRINLNSLLEIDANGKVKVNEVMVKRFEHLLELLGLNKEIAQAVMDWIDPDIDTRFNGGAEDDYYMLQDPPYRAANGLMASTSELMLLNGVDDEAYQLLLPHVSALPDRKSPININTATAEVLASLADSMTIADGEALIEAQPEDGFAKIEDFSGQSLLSSHPTYKGDALDIKSSFFLVNALAEFDQSTVHLHSLLQRSGDGAVRVVMRSRGAY